MIYLLLLLLHDLVQHLLHQSEAVVLPLVVTERAVVQLKSQCVGVWQVGTFFRVLRKRTVLRGFGSLEKVELQLCAK